MKNKATLLVGFAALLVGVLLLYSATYTVRFNEFAIRTRIDGDSMVVREAGLHFKLPFVFASVAILDIAPVQHQYCLSSHIGLIFSFNNTDNFAIE